MHMESEPLDLNDLKCSGGCGRHGQFATFGTFEGWRTIYLLCEFCLPRWEQWKAKMQRSSVFALETTIEPQTPLA
jgi:hypothetical protein